MIGWCLGENSNPEHHVPPSFKTNPKVYKEEIGDTAILLCKVKNLGKPFY